MANLPDETGLDKTAANYAALTPLTHLIRAKQIFPNHEAVVYGNRRHDYKTHYSRCTQLGSALIEMGVKPGDVVSVLLPNTLPMAECSFGVPSTGAVLNTINTRLDIDTLAYIFDHAEASVIIADTSLLDAIEAALATTSGKRPQIIEVADDQAGLSPTGNYPVYEDLVMAADPNRDWYMPQDEWESLALNYTSGTTGRPKGVVYHHRGALLMTLGTTITWALPRQPRYLTIVPLFHCNGWCHTWMMPAVGGTVVCNRDVTAKNIFAALADEKVTHFGGAPIVLNMLVNAEQADRREIDHVVNVMTAGAPPSPATIKGMEEMGFNVLHVYGLTETYGHITEAAPQPAWDALTDEARFTQMARQGVGLPTLDEVTVVDQETREKVPHDGKTLGEITVRGNLVMKGYYKNPEATKEAFEGGAFRSGDIAYIDETGYIQIADRLKDIIISGGENVSSVEVEATLMSHPAVSLCAVVAKSDEKWGETPCAFVELKAGQTVDGETLIAHCRSLIAGFKCPKHVVFCDLPKTSTGKVQKFELRQQAEAL